MEDIIIGNMHFSHADIIRMHETLIQSGVLPTDYQIPAAQIVEIYLASKHTQGDDN